MSLTSPFFHGPVGPGRMANKLMKRPGEEVSVVVPKLGGNFLDAQLGVFQQPTRLLHTEKTKEVDR